MTGPESDYEEFKFKTRVLVAIGERDCHFTDTPCLSLLKHLQKVQGVPSNDSLADG